MTSPPELDPLFIPPSNDELLEMPAAIRVRYLHQLVEFDFEHGTHLYRDFKRAKERCPHTDPETGERCSDQRWPDREHCLRHASLEELDPKGHAERRSRAAKLRMAELLDKAVDQLEELLDNQELAPQVKLAVLTTVFDRGNLPKVQAQTLDGHVEVSHSVSPADTIRDRIARLADVHVQAELRGIESASQSSPADPEVIDGEVIDEDET